MSARTAAGFPPITEAAFQDQVLELARLRGWLRHHVRAAQTFKGWRTPIQGDVGFPDLVLVRPPRLLFVELKSEAGRLRPEQITWLDALGDCGETVEAYTWRPSDWRAIEVALS